MIAPRLYAALCLSVLGMFVYAKYQGRVPFNYNATESGGGSGGGIGGHGAGSFMGGHK